uniref:Uncharacterized protein n=1 Tax=Panagrolaimus superbus TaxID=310955 RepID=A0A914Z3L4_9BILA
MDFGVIDFYDMDSPAKNYKPDIFKPAKKTCKKRLFNFFIKNKCTENSMFLTNLCIGITVMVMQILPIVTQNWLYVTEPRPINLTNDKGDQLEAPFQYTAGHFKVCRSFVDNVSAEIEPIIKQRDYVEPCQWNPIYTGNDLTDFSFATVGILIRLGVPTLMHIIGAFLCIIAFFFALLGYFKKDSRSVISAIFYVIGGLTVSMSVLQFVCVVDDEMAPRMKPNAAGEPSFFSYRYGYSFMAAALSFLPAQLCIYLQTQMYFQRYPTPGEKSKVIPGLEDLLVQVRKKERYSYRQETGTTIKTSSPKPKEKKCYFNASRRSTRASRDFTAFSIQRDLPLSPPLTAPAGTFHRDKFCY